MRLWTQPVDARDAPEAAFGEVYADPVVVNGTQMTITELTGRARSLQRAFDRLGMHILDTVGTHLAAKRTSRPRPVGCIMRDVSV